MGHLISEIFVVNGSKWRDRSKEGQKGTACTKWGMMCICLCKPRNWVVYHRLFLRIALFDLKFAALPQNVRDLAMPVLYWAAHKRLVVRVRAIDWFEGFSRRFASGQHSGRFRPHSMCSSRGPSSEEYGIGGGSWTKNLKPWVYLLLLTGITEM